jgi:hypothetical protein
MCKFRTLMRIIYTILILLVFSCKENHKKDAEKPNIKKESKTNKNFLENKIKIGDLNKSKKTLDGAGCYFTNNEKLVFVDNSDNGPLILINEKLLNLKEISRIEKNQETSTTYENESFKIILKTRSIETIDYSESFEGTLEIKDLKNNTLKIDINGECGC